MKVNLPIFKEEKTKDARTYGLWWWDIAIFCCSGWDNQHLLPYVFWLLQGFLGDLARSLDKDATLDDVLQMLDEHYGMVMTFGTPSKELYFLKQGSGENVAKFGVCLSQQVQILQFEVSRKNSTGACRGNEAGLLLQWPEPQIQMNAGP